LDFNLEEVALVIILYFQPNCICSQQWLIPIL